MFKFKVLFKMWFFAFGFLLLALSPLEATLMLRLDAKVIGIDDNRNLLFVGFEHPVSGVYSEKTFVIEDETRFKRIKDLSGLRKGDLVSVDYREEGGELVAIYVDVIPIKETPVVTQQELFESLFKIKTSSEPAVHSEK